MLDFRSPLRAAAKTIRGVRPGRLAQLESDRRVLRRELSALQNQYLELGLRASLYAQETALAEQQWRATRDYLGMPSSISGATLPPAPEPPTSRHTATTAADTDTVLPPRTLLPTPGYGLERDIVQLRRELAALGDDVLVLGEFADRLAVRRDAVRAALHAARERADLPEGCVQAPSAAGVRQAAQTRTSELEQALAQTRRDHAEALQRTRLEKNDLEIRHAEDADRFAALDEQRRRLKNEIVELNRQLASSENRYRAAQQEIDALERRLQLARAAQDSERDLVADLETRCEQLELQTREAREQIEELELSLAAAACQQEVAERELRAAQARAAAEAQRPVADDAAAPGGVKWSRLAAGALFLFGVLASGNRVLDSLPPGQALLGSDVSRSAGTAAQPATDATRASAAPPATEAPVMIAALEAGDVQAEQKPADADKPTAKKKPTIRRNTLPFSRDNRLSARLGSGGAHSHSWLMEADNARVLRQQACEQRGVDAAECDLLEDKLLNEGVIRLPGGLQYTVIRNGTGIAPGIDDRVEVRYKGMLLDGQVFDSTPQGSSVVFRMDEIIDGLQDALQYMEEGAIWEVYIPADLAFRKPSQYGGRTLVFEIELLAVEPAQQPGDRATAEPGRSTPPGDKAITELAATETPTDAQPWRQTSSLTVQEFFALNADREGVISLPSGLQYRVLERGGEAGARPAAGDTVWVRYRAMLPDGSEFDSSLPDSDGAAFELANVMPGWREALQQMQTGDRWELYIPPPLAQATGTRKRRFGRLGGQPLIYDIELVGVDKAANTDTP